MSQVGRPIKHFTLHRLDGVELRVVADVESPAGVLSLIQAESEVVTQMAKDVRWLHETVTLFVLSDLSPLQRQLQALGRLPAGYQELGDLLAKPVVNMYDLAAPTACHVFVNQEKMVAAGYWNDLLAIQGLLAHEHAHPLSECAATEAVRQLQLTLNLQLASEWAADAELAATWSKRAEAQLLALAKLLCLVAPRELFTNEIAMAAGFSKGLLHLNQQNVRLLVAGLAHRPLLQAQLTLQRDAGRLSQAGADALSLIGDLQGHLPLAMEVAAFQRQGYQAEASYLMSKLQQELFPHLDPLVESLFEQICEKYTQLSTTANASQMADFVRGQLELLATQLAEHSIELSYQITSED